MSVYTDKAVRSVVDPTLLLEVSNYRKIEDMPENIPENYIFFYQLEDDDFKMAKWCKALAEEKGLQIVYIYEKKINIFKKEIYAYGVTPNRFLALINHAAYSKEGVSCLLINTECGQHLVEKYGAKIESYPVEFSNIAQVNTQLNRPTTHTRLRNSIRRAAMLVWKQFLSGISGTRSSYGECMTAFAECSAGKHGKAAAFGQNTHISVHQRQMFVKLLSILRPCNVHGFCL